MPQDFNEGFYQNRASRDYTGTSANNFHRRSGSQSSYPPAQMSNGQFQKQAYNPNGHSRNESGIGFMSEKRGGSRSGGFAGLKQRFERLPRPTKIIIVAIAVILLLLPLLALLALRSGGGGGGGGDGGGDSAPGNNIDVQTSYGTYRGALVDVQPFPALAADARPASLAEGSIRVRQWLGVPFAASTAGQNRFQPPQLRPVADGIQMALNNSVTCPQKLGLAEQGFLKTIGVETSYTQGEDCLTANIFAPAGSRALGNASVMIWFYGGAYQFGANSLVTYDAARWVAAQDDVIIVAVNYRMNVFGFPLSPQLKQSNNGSMNLGILDTRAAVDWVSSNIANFGGDPNRITLFGQSAGGIQADNYVFAYPDDTRIKGVISMSAGASFLLAAQYLDGTADVSAANSAWNSLASAMGCGTAGDSTQLTCMQNVDMNTLLTGATLNLNTFKPVVDNQTFFPDYVARLAAGNFAKVPLMASTTSDENNIYAQVNGHYSEAARDALHLQNGTNDLWCAARASVQARRKAGVASSWQVTYYATPENISPDQGLGAYHTSDISIVFGTYDKIVSSIPITSNEASIAVFMQGLYTAFARDPTNGLTKYGLVNPEGSVGTFNLGVHNQPNAVFDIGADRLSFCNATMGVTSS